MTSFPAYRYLQIEQSGDVLVAQLQPARITCDNVDDVRRELTALLTDYEPTKLVLNFQRVRFLFTRMLTVLLQLRRELQQCGGLLCLSNLQPPVVEVLSITRLLSCLPHCETEQEAVSYLTEVGACELSLV